VAFIKQHDYRVLVANSPGTGKSPTALGCISGDRAKLTPTLIICPASVVTNWCREARKWVKGAVIHAIADMSTPMPRRKVDIFVTSWSLLPMRYLEILAIKPRFIIVDEAHYAKSGDDTLRGQALSIIAKRAPHMIMLSGTPLVNKTLELETIKGLFGQEQEVPMIRRLLEEVLPEIPPKTRSRLPVTLRPKDETEYRKAEKDFASWLEEELERRMKAGEARTTAERALAAEALVKTGYLRRLLGLAKVPAAVDWVGRAVRIGEPVVVFCEHQEVVTRLQTLLTKQRIRHVTIDGGTGRKQRQVAIDAFQAGLVPVFIGTKAAKEGITLTRGRNLLFIERYFTSADEEQAEDRIRRFGQKYPTTIWFLHAENTLDERLSEIIDIKRKLVNDTIGSADIAESEEDAVIDLISAWHDNAAKPLQPTSQATDLGLGKPLPPLPSPNDCLQLTFRPPRWTKAAAKAWAAMHGFRLTNILLVDGNVRVSVHPLERFVPGRFQNVAISADITATVGLRKPSPKAPPARKATKPGPRRSTRRAAPRSPMLRGR
jgi:SNF2 family DNA or RNA helicase